MSESEKGLYIANVWKSMLTETARKQFEKNGWTVEGNWLNNKNLSPLHKVILAAPAYFDGAVLIDPKDLAESKIFSYLIYPDEMVGWNFASNSYRFEKQEAFLSLLEQASVLSESKFTLDLVRDVYSSILNPERGVAYLPVEFSRIAETRRNAGQSDGAPLRVLWNHMWRSDKGFAEALGLIDQLSRNYPNVEFWIARENLWGNNPDMESLKEATGELLTNLRQKGNVFFKENFNFKRALEYWNFLATFDIGFSVSYQEGFGLSMLEQASAGIACVVPPRESYLEIHKGALIADNVGEAISMLIDSTKLRKEISQSGQENARRFDAQDWAKTILAKIN